MKSPQDPKYRKRREAKEGQLIDELSESNGWGNVGSTTRYLWGLWLAIDGTGWNANKRDLVMFCWRDLVRLFARTHTHMYFVREGGGKREWGGDRVSVAVELFVPDTSEMVLTCDSDVNTGVRTGIGLRRKANYSSTQTSYKQSVCHGRRSNESPAIFTRLI